MKRKYIYINTCTESEIIFYQKYKIFPSELSTLLFKNNFSKESFKPIQKEMDRIFLEMKEAAQWQSVDFNPFEA